MNVRKQARKALDARFGALEGVPTQRPPSGWLRAIREALGMTASEVATRLGVSQPRLTRIERAELDGSLKLSTLERAADALGCRLVYFVVPKEGTLEGAVMDQARRVALERLNRAAHTMRLEDQEVDIDPSEVDELAANLAERHDLWKM